jgi:uncharacterized membrane protein
MWLFSQDGLWNGFRYLHVLSAVMWMGLLWFFNFVQTPAYAEMEAGARNNAFDKLTWRALWWFRWAAMATWVTGLIVIFSAVSGDGKKYDAAFWKGPGGIGLSTAILFAFLMLYNVWMVIWPAQQVVIANARAVQSGEPANPDAPKSARRGAMASRQNTIFSFSVFFFMLGASHFFGYASNTTHWIGEPSGSHKGIYYALVLIVAVLLEANALGMFGTEAGKANTKMYDTHKAAIWTAVILVVIWYGLFEILFRA